VSEFAVIWDIDGTLLPGSLERHLMAYMRRLPKGRSALLKAPWNLLRLSLSPQLPRWHYLKLAYWRNMQTEEMDSWIVGCLQVNVTPLMYAGPAAAIRKLHRSGTRQVFLSGTPRPLAQALAARLGVDEIIAASPQIKQHRYTGRLAEPHPRGRHKVLAAEKWLKTNGLTWDRIAAVADHWDDRFLLDRAGVPVVIGHDSRLITHARKNRWLVVRNPEETEALEPLVSLLTGYDPQARSPDKFR
jgi:phosphoserine phosphatase